MIAQSPCEATLVYKYAAAYSIEVTRLAVTRAGSGFVAALRVGFLVGFLLPGWGLRCEGDMREHNTGT